MAVEELSPAQPVPGPDLSPQPVEFPPGSVLAHVSVLVDSQEKYEVTVEGQTGGPLVQTSAKGTALCLTGCVSGHVPLNWQITDMR